MSIVKRVDDFQRNHPKASFPLAALYKFFDDQGGYLAALITYYGFVSLFPLLLVFTTALGIVLEKHEDLRNQIVDSTLNQIPVIGDQLSEPSTLSGGTVAVVIGMAGALYGGLGVAVASQNAMNQAWAVPRNLRPNPIKVRLRGAVMLMTVGLAMVALVAVNVTVAAMDLGSASHYVATAGATLLALTVFVFAFRHGTVRSVSVGDVLPGAVLAAVGWQVLQHFGGYYAEHVIARASVVNSLFATVLGLLAFIYIAATLVVFGLEINAVRVDKLYPRSLLTEFTDNVQLTQGDERTYTHLAQAQRNKGFQKIDVVFENPLDEPPDDTPTEPMPPS